ncbi:MAG: hypothetical protein M3M85_03330 [bacterium]|nr:hypothetical protein [bacterium]
MTIKRKNVSKTMRGGYALLEALFYVSFFAAMSLAVTSAMITITSSFRETAISAKLAESAGIMERVAREVRGAEDIILISADNLKLSTTDAGSQPKTVEFLLDGANVEFLENDNLTGNLNAPNIAVSGLSFTQITTAAGKAVKVHITLGVANDKLGRTFDFYDTIVLRGNY